MSFETESLKSYRRVYKSGKSRKNNLYLSLVKSYLGDYLFWFYILGSFMLSRSTLIEGMAPFGLALIIALKKEKSGYIFPALLGGFAGEYFRGDYVGTFILIVITAGEFLLDSLQKKLNFNDFNWWISTAVLIGGVKLPSLYPGFGSYELYNLIFEMAIVVVTGIIFCQGVNHIEKEKWPKSYTKEEVIPLSLLFILMVFGMQDFMVWGLNLQYIFASILVLMFAYGSGGGIGASVGALLGTVLVLSNPNPAAVGALTLGGFIGGVFNDFKKPGVLMGFIIGASIMTFYLGRPYEIITSFYEILVGGVLFLVIPVKLAAYINKAFPLNIKGMAYDEDRKYLGEMLSKRTRELASVFNELSNTFDESSEIEERNKVEIEIFMSKVAGSICFGCKRYDCCWEKNFFTLYRGIVETLSNLENKDYDNDFGNEINDKDLSPHLIKNCLKPAALKEQLKSIYEQFKLEVHWQQKIGESQEFVARQLSGISEIMKKISGELEVELKKEEELETKVINRLLGQNVPVNSIEIEKMGNGKHSISIELKECKKKDTCVKDINKEISEILAEKLMVVKSSCFYRDEDSKCNFKLSPVKSYNVVTGISQLAGGDENTCGDSCLSRQLKSGQHLLLLSDGMGKGKDARADSESAVKLLEKLLNSGFERNFVIKNVNKVLSLKNKNESFVTMDMAIIDLLNGECEFYKAGAMPTYILRGNEVQKVGGTALPAGILNSIEPSIEGTKLRDGDKLVMVSDGAFTSDDNDEDKDWLKKELESLEDLHPQVVADELAGKVKRRFYGDVKDDVTIMVSKVKKNFRMKD